MSEISEDNLVRITGGGANVWIGVAIAAIVVFISGVIEGITNPGRCNE